MANMVDTLVNGRWNIKLPEHRALRPEWHTSIGWERKRLDALYTNITDVDVVYYAGGEEGEMPALCQIWGAKVFITEPNPRVWSNIRAIWEANKLEKPLGYFVGFNGCETIKTPPDLDFDNSDKDGWPLCAYGEVIGDHGFRELCFQSGTTPQIRIDDSGVNPTIISLDVEGAEGAVIAGAVETIRRCRPKIFLSGHPEFCLTNYGHYLYETRKFIMDLGYDEILLDYKHEAHFLYLSKSTPHE